MVALRDTAYQQEESSFLREYKDSYLYSHHIPVAKGGLYNQNIPIVRPYFIKK